MGVYSDMRKGLKKAKTLGKSIRKILPGEHVFEILKVAQLKTRKKVEYVAVELRCLASDNEDMKVGTDYDWATFSTNEYYDSHVKGVILAATGLSEDAFDDMSDSDSDELLEAIFGEESLLSGKVVNAFSQALTLQAGYTEPLIVTNFSFHDGSEEEQEELKQKAAA